METVVLVIIGLMGVCAFLVHQVWRLEKEMNEIHKTVNNLAHSTSDFAQAVMEVFASCKKEDE